LANLLDMPHRMETLNQRVAGSSPARHFSPKTVSNGPTILTTTGIFATFLGIALGLAEFDTANVQASVPALLAGLKTAFWASVAGVCGALSLKFRDHIFSVRSAGEPTGAPAADEVTAAHIASHLVSIQRGLVGGEEGSLISQLKLSRQDTNDRLDALRVARLDFRRAASPDLAATVARRATSFLLIVPIDNTVDYDRVCRQHARQVP
jgi:hypothetical protein